MGCRCQTPAWARVVPEKESDATCETKLLAYPYHVNKQPRCGDELTLATAAGPVTPEAGKWYTLTSHIKMNTAGAPSSAQLNSYLVHPPNPSPALGGNAARR